MNGILCIGGMVMNGGNIRGFIVRKAVSEDVEDIYMVTREAFKMYKEESGITNKLPALNETIEQIEYDIENKLCFVAEMDNQVVGAIRVEIFEDDTAYLSRFAVLGGYQHMGIGRGLVDEVDSKMKSLKIKKIYLHTAAKMFSLVRFYYGRGFFIDSTTKDRGYIRGLFCKEYEYNENESEDNKERDCENRAV
jgi:predicted N-acetyltransferase YhbS